MAAPPISSGPSSLPLVPNGKASVAPPTVSNAESNSKSQEEDKLPLHEDIMQLARLGETAVIQKLIEDGNFTAQYRDGEGISPLHVCSDGITVKQLRDRI